MYLPKKAAKVRRQEAQNACKTRAQIVGVRSHMTDAPRGGVLHSALAPWPCSWWRWGLPCPWRTDRKKSF